MRVGRLITCAILLAAIFFPFHPALADTSAAFVGVPLDTTEALSGTLTVDVTPPPLELSAPPEMRTRGRRLAMTFKGTTSPRLIVLFEDLTGEPMGTAEADNTGAFEFSIDRTYEVGSHGVRVRVADEAGNAASVVRTITILPEQSWYVSPSGDDANSGDAAARPFQTVGRAIAAAGSEDNLYLMPGVHRSGGIQIDGRLSGSVHKPTQLSALPGAEGTVTLEMSNGVLAGVTRLRISGIRFSSAGGNQVFHVHSSQNIEFVNNRWVSPGFALRALILQTSSEITIVNNTFEGRYDEAALVVESSGNLAANNLVQNIQRAVWERGPLTNRYQSNNFLNVTASSIFTSPPANFAENYERRTDGAVRSDADWRAVLNDTGGVPAAIDLDGDGASDGGREIFWNSAFEGFSPFVNQSPTAANLSGNGQALRGVFLREPLTLGWEYVDPDLSTQTAVQIQIATDRTFANPAFDRTVSMTDMFSFEVPTSLGDISSGPWFVRLRVSDPSRFGPFSGGSDSFILDRISPRVEDLRADLNPFMPPTETTVISFVASDNISEFPGTLSAEVVDAGGRFVAALASNRPIAYGPQSLVWDGKFTPFIQAEDFNDRVANDFTEAGGTWSFRDGGYVYNSSGVGDWKEFSRTNRSYGDFDMEVDIKAVGGQFPGVNFRIDPAGRNFYTVYFRIGFSEFGELGFEATADGRRLARDFGVAPAVVSAGRAHRLKIRAEGARIRIWLDGHLKFDVVDGGRPISEGFIGLTSWVHHEVVFDNFRVSTIVSAEAALPGEYRVDVSVADPAGNVGTASAGVRVVRDTEPPVFVRFFPDGGQTFLARRDTIVISIGATDNFDSVPSVSAQLVHVENGAADLTVSVSDGQQMSAGSIARGQWKLVGTATDRSGNSATREGGLFTVTDDAFPPRTTLSVGEPKFSPPAGAVFVSPSTGYAFSAVDDLIEVGDSQGVGVALTEFRVDDGAFQNAALRSPVEFLLTEGRHPIGYRSRDAAGNVEAERRTEVVVDGTPPSTAISVDLAGVDPSDTTVSVLIAQSRITFASADGGLEPSGVGRIEFRIDSGPVHIFSEPFDVSDLSGDTARHDLSFRGVDRVDNGEATRTFGFRVAPALSATKAVSFTPRVLVWLNSPPSPPKRPESGANTAKEGDVSGEFLNRIFDSLVLRPPAAPERSILLFDVVDQADSFVSFMRTDSYNVYVILGEEDNLSKERQWELSERVRMGDGLIVSGLEEIEIPGKDRDEDEDDDEEERERKAAGNLLGVEVDGRHSDKDILLALGGAAIPYTGEYRTSGRTSRVRSMAPGAVGDGFIAPNGKNKSPEPAVVTHAVGSGRTVFLAFDLVKSAAASNAAATEEFLRAALRAVIPTREVFIPTGRAAVAISVTSPVVPSDLAVRIEEVLPEDASVVAKQDGKVEGGHVVVWDLTLSAGGSDTREYVLGLPDAGGAGVPTTADVSYRVRGSYFLFDSLKLTLVTEKSLPDLLDEAVRQLTELAAAPRSDRSRIKKAVEKLNDQRLSPPVTARQIEDAIQEILKIVRDLGGLAADPESVSALRDTLDTIVMIYGRWLSL